MASQCGFLRREPRKKALALNSPLVEIGAELRQARENQQRSLDELSQVTLIHVRHLQALEEGREADLPEPFYVKNFIRKYANSLGLPGDAMANRYWDTRPLPAQPPRQPAGPDVMVPWWVFPAMLGALLLGAIATFAVMNASRSPEAAGSQAATRASGEVASGPAVATEPASGGAATTPVASGSAAASETASGGIVSSQVASGPADVRLATPAATGAASLPAPGATGAPGTSPTATPYPVTLPPLVVPDHEISFKTWNKEAAWMQIVADGREIHSGIVPRNTVRTWVARQSLAVRIGRPGVVSARLGDRPLGVLADKDAPVYRRTFFTREGFAAHEATQGGSDAGNPAVLPGGQGDGQAGRQAGSRGARQVDGRSSQRADGPPGGPAGGPESGKMARAGNQPAARRSASPRPRPTARPTTPPPTAAPALPPESGRPETPQPEPTPRTLTVE